MICVHFEASPLIDILKPLKKMLPIILIKKCWMLARQGYLNQSNFILKYIQYMPNCITTCPKLPWNMKPFQQNSFRLGVDKFYSPYALDKIRSTIDLWKTDFKIVVNGCFEQHLDMWFCYQPNWLLMTFKMAYIHDESVISNVISVQIKPLWYFA